MPINLAELQNDERTCEVTYEGQTAQVTYRPSAYTPALEDALQTALESGRPSSGIARLLEGVLLRWELLDENGEELPTTYEVMRELPSAFLVKVINTVTADMQAGREDRKNSGDGSRRKGSLASARTGIH